MPITTTTGLLSDKIKKVIQKDSLIFIATDQDLSVFLDNQDFPFPLLIDNYSTQDGLSSEQINSIRISSDDILFLGTDNGLDLVHLDSMNTVSSWYNLNVDNSMIPGNEVSSISLRDNKIALGTDSFISEMHGRNATELPLMMEIGDLSAMETIVAGTKNAAECCLLGDDVGTLESGKLADFLLVEGNPLDDISMLQDTERLSVYKDGVLVK